MSTEFYPLTIGRIEKLTKDSVVIDFYVPEQLQEKFIYRQGQHLTLKTNINGHDVRRSYSICAGVNNSALRVAVKAIQDGIFSNFANKSLNKGMQLDVMPPQGHFYSELNEASNKQYLLVAVGSGITPMLSQIETLLDKESNSQVTLLYGNKSTSLMMFREHLCFLKNQYINRLKIIHFFTKEDNDTAILNGRINTQKIIDLDSAKMITIKDFSEIFICGPEAMTLDIAKAFSLWGLDEDHIHYELFFSGETVGKAEQTRAARAEKYGKKISNISVKIAGRKVLMELEMGGNNILEAAIENGADLPFSCKAGVCATCKAKVVDGKVEMDTNHSLTEKELAAGMILTCQAHPISKNVEIDFDFS